MLTKKKIQNKPPLLLSSWLYRIRPAVCHKPWQKWDGKNDMTINFNEEAPNPAQLRWHPFNIPEEKDGKVNFVQVWYPLSTHYSDSAIVLGSAGGVCGTVVVR